MYSKKPQTTKPLSNLHLHLQMLQAIQSEMKVSSHSSVGTSHGCGLSKTYLKRETAINDLSFPQLPIRSANYDQKLFITFFIHLSIDVGSCVIHRLYQFVLFENFPLGRPLDKA